MITAVFDDHQEEVNDKPENIFTIEDIEYVVIVTLKIHKETLRHNVKIPPNNNNDKEVCHE